MALEDNTFPQSGDPDDAVRFAQLIGQGNILNHVESGLTVTPDFVNGTASISEGVCFIEVASDTATSDSQEIQGLGYAIQVAADSVTLLTGDNHIAVVPAYGTNDSNSVETYGTESNIPASALRIAYVDEAGQTTTEYNRQPNGEFEDITVKNGVTVNNGQELLATQNWVDNSIATAIYTDSDAVTAIDGEISIAAASVSGLDSAVDTNETNISSNDTDISNLQSNKFDAANYTPVSAIDSEISLAATNIGGLDSAVDSNDADISNLQSNKFDAINYNPETDTHTRYADSEAISAVDGEISLAATNIGGLDSVVDSNSTDISNLQTDKFDAVNYTPETDTHTKYTDSEAITAADAEISLAALSVSGLDSQVDTNVTDISNLQSDKFDAVNYNPEADTHNKYTDSEALSAVETEISVAALSVGGLDSQVDTNVTDISNLQANKLDLSGGTMTGDITLTDGSISASQSWVNNNADVPNADYADSAGNSETVNNYNVVKNGTDGVGTINIKTQ